MTLSSAYIKVSVLAVALILGCAAAAYGTDTQSPAESLQSAPGARLLTAIPSPLGLRPLDSSPTAETPTFRVFLPNIQKPLPTATPTTTPTPTPTLTPTSTPTTAPVSGIYGRVTLNGIPVAESLSSSVVGPGQHPWTSPQRPRMLPGASHSSEFRRSPAARSIP